MNSFWWGNGGSNKGIRWLSWEKMCKAKEGGGLGFKELNKFNIAILAKKGWRLLNNQNSLVSGIMKAKYYPDCDFLQAKLGTNPSYMWRSILAAQEVVRQGSRRKMGDGEQTSVWHIPWLPGNNNGFVTTEMPQELGHIRVANLMETESRCWDDEVLKTHGYGTWMKSGRFSVKSYYRAVQALVMKRVQIIIKCPWCLVKNEDATHVLFDCPFARAVWTNLGLHEVSTMGYEGPIIEIIHQLENNCPWDTLAFILMVCWNLWSPRNRWVWDKVSVSEFGVQATAMSMMYEWRQRCAAVKNHKVVTNGSLRRWKRPQQGWIKVNTDATVFRERGATGI
ncbi:hypothetical protein AgCh_002800 [Apium graveolens]